MRRAAQAHNALSERLRDASHCWVLAVLGLNSMLLIVRRDMVDPGASTPIPLVRIRKPCGIDLALFEIAQENAVRPARK